MTTRPQALAWRERLGAVVGDHDALAGREAVVLHDVRRARTRRAPQPPRSASSTRRGARRRHSGGGHDVLGERLRPLQPGGRQRTGRSSRCRRPARRRRRRRRAAPPARRRPGRRRAGGQRGDRGGVGDVEAGGVRTSAAMPALPGAQAPLTAGSASSARTSACSRAPPPRTRTRPAHGFQNSHHRRGGAPTRGSGANGSGSRAARPAATSVVGLVVLVVVVIGVGVEHEPPRRRRVAGVADRFAELRVVALEAGGLLDGPGQVVDPAHHVEVVVPTSPVRRDVDWISP